MAIVANTYLTFDAKALREDLTDAIYNISPEDTPYQANIGRGKAGSTFHEWQTDALASPDGANAKVQGDDVASFPAVAPTVRLGNRTQISRKEIIIAETLEAVSKAGRKSEEAYQMAKRSAELKRDVETILLQNQGSLAGGTSTAPKTASLLAFLKTNTDIGSGGVDPVYTSEPTDVRTDGTQRAFTETILKAVAQKIWNAGGDLRLLMVGGHVKTVASGFAGVATKTFYQSAVKETAIIGAADVYVSDFGKLAIVANRFQRARDALFIDPSMASLNFLRPFKREKLAKTGDAEKRMIVGEYVHVVKNEAAHGIAADLSTS